MQTCIQATLCYSKGFVASKRIGKDATSAAAFCSFLISANSGTKHVPAVHYGTGVLSFSVGLVSGSLVAIAIATASGVYANPVARGLLTRAAGAILMMGALISVF